MVLKEHAVQVPDLALIPARGSKISSPSLSQRSVCFAAQCGVRYLTQAQGMEIEITYQSAPLKTDVALGTESTSLA